MQGKSATKEVKQSEQLAKRAKLRRNHWGDATDVEVQQRQQQLRQQQLAGPPDYLSSEKTKAAAQLAGTQFCLDISSCSLPTKRELFKSTSWTLPAMLGPKASLNAVKSQLDSKDGR